MDTVVTKVDLITESQNITAINIFIIQQTFICKTVQHTSFHILKGTEELRRISLIRKAT